MRSIALIGQIVALLLATQDKPSVAAGTIRVRPIFCGTALRGTEWSEVAADRSPDGGSIRLDRAARGIVGAFQRSDAAAAATIHASAIRICAVAPLVAHGAIRNACEIGREQVGSQSHFREIGAGSKVGRCRIGNGCVSLGDLERADGAAGHEQHPPHSRKGSTP